VIKEISIIIPENLSDAVSQLNEYFLGKRNDFTFKLNPKGFSAKVWKRYSCIRKTEHI
jgi:methylated-DNA-[protein]-cysteine S-methyltransferase